MTLELSLYHYVVLSTVLFAIGAYGIITAQNAVRILMSIEIVLNSANINLVAFSSYLGDLGGQVLATFTIAVAAAEAGIGLAILLVLYRNFGTVNMGDIKNLRW